MGQIKNIKLHIVTDIKITTINVSVVISLCDHCNLRWGSFLLRGSIFRWKSTSIWKDILHHGMIIQPRSNLMNTTIQRHLMHDFQISGTRRSVGKISSTIIDVWKLKGKISNHVIFSRIIMRVSVLTSWQKEWKMALKRAISQEWRRSNLIRTRTINIKLNVPLV